ncbi:hypothetical protein RDABS01_016126 [Bienertia sinuspersici]
MGKFLGFDDSNPFRLNNFMRLKVPINIEKPLRRGLKIATHPNTSKWVDIKYERLDDFYYYCGKLGHVDRDCSFIDSYEGSSKEMVYKYGLWLRASSLKRGRGAMEGSEKERKLLNKFQNMSSCGTNNDGEVVIKKLGPPSSARKALF